MRPGSKPSVLWLYAESRGWFFFLLHFFPPLCATYWFSIVLSDIRFHLLSWLCCCLKYSARDDMGGRAWETLSRVTLFSLAQKQRGVHSAQHLRLWCCCHVDIWLPVQQPISASEWQRFPGRQPVISLSFGRRCCDTSLVSCDPENAALITQTWTTRSCKQAVF